MQHHFLLIYNHRDQALVGDPATFDRRDLTGATEAYQRAEFEHHDDPDIEIVLIGADSLATIARTHGHYLASTGDRLEQYLARAAASA